MKRIMLTVLLGLAAFAAVWYGFNPLIDKTAPQIAKAPVIPLTSGTYINTSKPIEDFTLTSTDEKVFTKHSLQGHWTLLFFGYAECPAICPTTLAMIAKAWNSLPDYTRNNSKDINYNSKDNNVDNTKNNPSSRLSFVFVSLDPKADTPQKLRNFLGKFNPDFIGLTGDESVIQKLCKSCSVYSLDVTNQNSNNNANNPNGNTNSQPKIIDHSATLILVNPKGDIQALFSPPHQVEALVNDLKLLIH